MENEIHVDFCIFNFTETIDEVTTIMGCSPSKAWLKGDNINSKLPKYVTTHNRWVLSSRLELNSCFEDHLESLLTQLENQKDNVKRVLEIYDSGIYVAIYFHEINPGFKVSNELARRVSQLGLSIDFDLYCLGESDLN